MEPEDVMTDDTDDAFRHSPFNSLQENDHYYRSRFKLMSAMHFSRKYFSKAKWS